MSVVYYKFRSAKDFDTATFDGTGISVFDLKREIMLAKKLGKGADFDLEIAHAQTAEGESQRNKPKIVAAVSFKKVPVKKYRNYRLFCLLFRALF